MKNDRDAAPELDASKVDDEADRPEGDKSPGYANLLMAEPPASAASKERSANKEAEEAENS